MECQKLSGFAYEIADITVETSWTRGFTLLEMMMIMLMENSLLIQGINYVYSKEHV